MLYSQIFGKTVRTAPSDEVAINAKLLLQAGFIDKLMTGSFSLLPLGKKVEEKIRKIITKEMNLTGAEEILMPLLHPKSIWNETGRWEKAKEVMYQFKKDEKDYGLSFTHEEIVLDLIRKHTASYKDFPVKVYQFSNKFRNEPRAKSGILRGREFLMKDLYSVHVNQKDMDKYYWQVADSYKKVFNRLGLLAKLVEAAGGVFTEQHTHEFQVLSDSGEDTIFYCGICDFAQNKEIAQVSENDKCPKCSGKIKIGRSIEVGNIFRFGTSYSEKMSVTFTNEKGEKHFPFLASYGIGVTRLIGTIVEIYHDEKGIIWPISVAPYQVHMFAIGGEDTFTYAKEIYDILKKNGLEVLFDDRIDKSAGEKFADADLIGIPLKIVVSEKNGEKLEISKRSNKKILLVEKNKIIEAVAEFIA